MGWAERKPSPDPMAPLPFNPGVSSSSGGGEEDKKSLPIKESTVDQSRALCFRSNRPKVLFHPDLLQRNNVVASVASKMMIQQFFPFIRMIRSRPVVECFRAPNPFRDRLDSLSALLSDEFESPTV